jgi:hypothetical protein
MMLSITARTPYPERRNVCSACQAHHHNPCRASPASENSTKARSDDISPILKLQGVNTLLRKAISTASVYLKISQPSENEIRMDQTATAVSIPGTTGQYILDYEWRKYRDPFFGQIRGRSRWIDRGEVEEERLKDGLDNLEEGRLIEATGGDRRGQVSATHIWGFLEIQGERKHVRKVVVKGKNHEEVRIVMVYDWAK